VGFATATELASMLSDVGESVVLPGGKTVTTWWYQATVETLDTRGTAPRCVGRYTDVKDLARGDRIWRASKGADFIVRDIVHDGFEDMTTLAVEEQ